jgi:arginyl-tRNA synthetase
MALYNQAKQISCKSILEAMASLNISVEEEEVAQSIEDCSFSDKGQISFKTFKYAKHLKKSPAEVSALIAQALSELKNISKASADSGFVNIFIKNDVLADSLIIAVDKNDQTVRFLDKQATKILIEHSQPNTHKELHVGHTRNTILGDTLCSLYKFSGYEVIAENYHGDEGAHVAKCLWYMSKNNLKPAVGEDPGTWLGKIYTQSNSELVSAANTPLEEIYKNEISAVLQQIENKSGKFFDLWKETREWSLDLFRKMYEWLGVTFDSWVSESDVSEQSFKIVDKYYKDGLFIKSEGAIGADLSDANLGFFMLLKSDGRGLYSTKDIALALRRNEKYDPNKTVYVVDNRQSHHFKQVFATLKKMGLKVADNCFHLAYELVETTTGPMSSRNGTIIPMLKLIENMEVLCQENILSRQSSKDINDGHIETAKKIAVAAVRYGMIKVDPDSKIIFDMDSWLKVEGNTGPYLLYCYTRMLSLLNKANFEVDFSTVDWSVLDAVAEKSFLYSMAKLTETAADAASKMKPNIFANYTYDLCRAFNTFYSECPIISENDPEKRKARVALTKLGSIYLNTALNLLRIPTVSSM